MTLVGLTGYAQHGKDMVGGYLVDAHEFRRYAFADQLKELALYINPIITTQDGGYGGDIRLALAVEEGGWEKAKRLPEVRRFLQELGTGVRDIIGMDSWVRALEEKVLREAECCVVVTDVRFPNEADWIHRNGGTLWRVERINEDGTAYDNGIGTEHESEKHVPDLAADFLVTNKSNYSVATFETVERMMGTPRFAQPAEEAGLR